METEVKEKVVNAENVEKALKEYKPNAALQSANAIMPKTFQQVMEMSKVFATSGIVPDALKGKPEACAIAIMHGLELGVSPTQALNNIMIVNGRPSVWGDLMLALAQGSSDLEFFEEDAPDVALKQGFGRCTVKRVGAFNPVQRTFSIEDAKRANLWTKAGPWQQYPGRMLMFRARSWALRDCLPHVLKGLIMREEVEDYNVLNAEPVKMPQRVQGNVQDAQIIPSEPGIPAEQPGDAQEPVNTADIMVDDADRKELFKMRQEAKVSITDIKAYLKKTYGVEDTAKLTKGQAEELKAWIVKNAK
jgi:hypothetical protein